MKKNILTIVLLSLGLSIFAQTEYDALRLSQTEVKGTARYMSLGGAMGALGGDASALKDNPAGLGVYRSTELTLTTNVGIGNNSAIEWLGKTNQQDGYTKLSMNNLSYVLALPVQGESGLVGSNFSFSYQKLRDFNQSFAIGGNASGVSFTDYLARFSTQNPPIPGDISYDNFDMPWLTVLGYNGYLINADGSAFKSVLKENERATPNYVSVQEGSLGEYSFGWGGNFNNNLFIGTNLNIRSLEYRMKSSLKESFDGGGNFNLVNDLTQSGLGVNAKFGVIYLPTNGLRLGMSFHTPSLTYVYEESYADLHSSLIPATEDNPSKTRVNSQGFNLWSPMQVQASVAYVFGKSGLLSAEYDFINYPGMRLRKTANSTQGIPHLTEINNAMKNVVDNVHVLKLGGEFKITPSFALRAGYALTTPYIKKGYEDGKLLVPNSVSTNTEYFDQKFNTNFYSFGLGYRLVSWFFDVAYALQNQKSNFYPYQDKALDPAIISNNNHNIVMTVGLRM